MKQHKPIIEPSVISYSAEELDSEEAYCASTRYFVGVPTKPSQTR